MPLTITCPACQRTLRVPESLLGQAVKCPSCSHRFTTTEQSEDEAPPPRTSSGVRTTRRPVAPPVDEEDAAPRRTERIRDRPQPRPGRQDDEDEPPRPRRSDDDYDDYEERSASKSDRTASWNKVRIGINLVMIGIWVWLGGTLLGALGGLLSVLFLGSAVLSSTSSNQAAWTSLGFAGILLILSVGVYYLSILAEFVLRLVGYGLCMAAPPLRDSGLRPLSITAFALSAIQILFSCANFLVGGLSGFTATAFNRYRGGASTGYDAASTGLSGLSGLCAIGSFVVFLFFLRSVCNNIRARELASKPIAVLVAFVLFWVFTVITIVLVACGGGFAVASAFQGQSANRAASSLGTWVIITIVLICLAGLVYMGLQVWYIMVLQKIRDAVSSYRRRL